jgi:2-oxoglutarate ferredoxin oxidoreductase subunit alpha
MKGNEAIAEAAVRAGCRFFSGYPITPQNEIPEYLSRRLPQVGGVFLQSESELAGVYMLYGAAASGKRCMTSSSGNGISLMAEGISYLSGVEMPSVIVDMSRRGPASGGLEPTQSSYNQATKGGGHGGYRCIVLSPSSVQEAVDMIFSAFDLADRWRNPVYIYADGLIGQVMEPLELPAMMDVSTLQQKDWTLHGAENRPPRMIMPLINDEKFNYLNFEKYKRMENELQQWHESHTEEADYVVTGFGTVGRIIAHAVDRIRRETGFTIGVIRPLSLWPFPKKVYAKAAYQVKSFLVIEANGGQMLDDVKIAVNGKAPVYFEPTFGGNLPTMDEVLSMIRKFISDRGEVLR